MKITTRLKSTGRLSEDQLSKKTSNHYFSIKRQKNISAKETRLSKKSSLLKNIQINKKSILVIGIVSLVLLFIFVLVYIENVQERSFEKYTEITYIAPNQALIFWKTEEESMGYVAYGPSRFGKKEIVPQTSSESSTVHVVILENIPLEGTYIQKYSEGKPFWIIPKMEFISYETHSIDE